MNLQRWFDLFLAFAYRDVSIRYKQSLLGFWWAVLKPAISVVIFTTVFSTVVGLSLDSPYPYWFFVVTGIVPWLFFSFGLSEISGSILADSDILKKIAFPKILTPIASLIPSAIELLIAFSIILLMYLWFGHYNVRIFLIPFSILFIIICPFGFGLIFASLNVFYRDFRFIVPFVLQVGIYITPVGYHISNIPDWLLWLVSINPMVLGIEIFRWCLGITPFLPPSAVVLPGIVALMISWSIGIITFNKLQHKFADSI